MKSRRVDWTLWMLGVLCAVCIGTLVMYAVKARADVTITVTDAGVATVEPAPPSPVAFVGEWSSLIDGERCVSLRLEDGTQMQCMTGAPDPLLPAGRVIVTGDTGNWIQLQAAFPPGTTSVLREDGQGVRTYRLVNGLTAWRPHAGDFNRDARVDTQDVFDFLADWFSRPEASVGELYAFLADWAAGVR